MANEKLGVDLAFDLDDLLLTPTGDLALTEDTANVRAAVLRLLNTRPGDLLAHPDIGNPVWDMLSDPITDGWLDLAKAAILNCLEAEPRITVQNITTEPIPEQRLIRFVVSYQVLDEPGEENLVWEVNSGV